MYRFIYTHPYPHTHIQVRARHENSLRRRGTLECVLLILECVLLLLEYVFLLYTGTCATWKQSSEAGSARKSGPNAAVYLYIYTHIQTHTHSLRRPEKGGRMPRYPPVLECVLLLLECVLLLYIQVRYPPVLECGLLLLECVLLLYIQVRYLPVLVGLFYLYS